MAKKVKLFDWVVQKTWVSSWGYASHAYQEFLQDAWLNFDEFERQIFIDEIFDICETATPIAVAEFIVAIKLHNPSMVEWYKQMLFNHGAFLRIFYNLDKKRCPVTGLLLNTNGWGLDI